MSQLPPELSYGAEPLASVPAARTLLPGVQRWRALVDSQAPWLLILAPGHCALSPGLAYCVLRPIGCNLIRDLCGQSGMPRKRGRPPGRRGGAAQEPTGVVHQPAAGPGAWAQSFLLQQRASVSGWMVESNGSSWVAVGNLTTLTWSLRIPASCLPAGE